MTEMIFKSKEFVYHHHLTVPFRPLEVRPKKGIGKPSLDGNLIIHGDNLHALKALMPMYAGKVDCIFIDPPYNTGNEGWCYSDGVNSPMIKEWMSENPISIDDGLRHDKWCAMMWPRLRLLHELLSEEGSLWMTLDDNEIHRARGILDEIFGEQNFVACCIWQKIFSPKNTASFFSEDHDYVLIYAKNKGTWRPNLLERTADMEARYANPDNDPRGPWTSGDLSARNFYGEGTYAIITPSGRRIEGPPRGRYWLMKEEKFKELDSQGRVWWGKDGDNQPRLKRYLSDVKEGRVPQTIWFFGDVGHTQDAKKELLQIMDFNSSEDVFVTPKPTRLIQRVLELATSPDSIVLDSFAGSGTTAQAVLEANKKDGGSRRFILIEMEGYADKVTAERVRRVINGYEFKGTDKTELLREKITWSRLQKADALTEEVQAIENLHAHEYDAIKKTVKDGELIVTGEKTVDERTSGLGGGFTYCTLGDPVELDKLLGGEMLPSWEDLGATLFQTATNLTLDAGKVRQKDLYLGEADNCHLWLIYKPDLNWLKTPEAALTLERARKFAGTDPASKHLVFAPARFVSRDILARLNLPVEFVPLPFSLYRIEQG